MKKLKYVLYGKMEDGFYHRYFGSKYNWVTLDKADLFDNEKDCTNIIEQSTCAMFHEITGKRIEPEDNDAYLYARNAGLITYKPDFENYEVQKIELTLEIRSKYVID